MPVMKRAKPISAVVVEEPVASDQPFWATTDGSARIYMGDVMERLRVLPTGSVQCVVTSPPYFGLRNYGTGTWEGGDATCNHDKIPEPKLYLGSDGKPGHNNTNWDNRHADKHTCSCGAVRVDQQLGSEKLADCEDRKHVGNCAEECWETGCHVCRMVLVFRELRRVLRDDGVLWLNYGDSYNSNSYFNHGKGGKLPTNGLVPENGWGRQSKNLPGLKSGNLIGIPWRVALALQSDGWILRQDVIHAKPSPMPESAKNRCTKAHEYIFMLVKKMGYYFDNEAIKECAVAPNRVGFRGESDAPTHYANQGKLPDNSQKFSRNIPIPTGCDTGEGVHGTVHTDGRTRRSGNKERRPATERGCPQDGVSGNVPWEGNTANKRDVWNVDDENALLLFLQENYPDVVGEYLSLSMNKGDTWRVASTGYPGLHFATFSENLITPCILAGSSEFGCCADCRAPYRRVTEEKKLVRDRPREYVKRTGEAGTGNSCANTVAGVEVKTVGWAPTCSCRGVHVETVKKKLFYGRWTDNAENAESGHDFVRYKDADPDPTEVDTAVSEHVEVEQLFNVSDNRPAVVPCIILDPFLGSATTSACALKHGRHAWGIELSDKYIVNNAIPRITTRLYDLGLGHLVPDLAQRTESVGDEVELG